MVNRERCQCNLQQNIINQQEETKCTGIFFIKLYKKYMKTEYLYKFIIKEVCKRSIFTKSLWHLKTKSCWT